MLVPQAFGGSLSCAGEAAGDCLLAPPASAWPSARAGVGPVDHTGEVDEQRTTDLAEPACGDARMLLVSSGSSSESSLSSASQAFIALTRSGILDTSGGRGSSSALSLSREVATQAAEWTHPEVIRSSVTPPMPLPAGTSTSKVAPGSVAWSRRRSALRGRPENSMLGLTLSSPSAGSFFASDDWQETKRAQEGRARMFDKEARACYEGR
jgi:hypothetical protein